MLAEAARRRKEPRGAAHRQRVGRARDHRQLRRVRLLRQGRKCSPAAVATAAAALVFVVRDAARDLVGDEHHEVEGVGEPL